MFRTDRIRNNTGETTGLPSFMPHHMHALRPWNLHHVVSANEERLSVIDNAECFMKLDD